MRRRAELILSRIRTLGLGRKRWLATGLIVVFSSSILGLMLWHYLPSLLAYHWQLNVLPLILGFVIYSFDLMLAILGWSTIMGKLADKLTFREHVRIYSLVMIAGRLPGLPWHLFGRAALYKRHGISNRVTGVAAGLELILIIVSGILSSAWMVISLPENMQQRLIWLILILVIGLGLLHPCVVRKVLQWLGHTQIEIQLRYQDMLLLVLLYTLIWIVSGIVLYVVILALHPLPFTKLFSVIGAWSLSGVASSLVSLSPSNFGIREITLGLLLAPFLPAGLGIVVALLIRLYLTAVELIWSIVASRL